MSTLWSKTYPALLVGLLFYVILFTRSSFTGFNDPRVLSGSLFPVGSKTTRRLPRETKPVGNDSFMLKMQALQKERHRRLFNACSHISAEHEPRGRIARSRFGSTFNIEGLETTYCAIPKCSTTVWFTFLERITRNVCPKATVHSCARINFRKPASFASFLSNSLVIVRNPWHRIVSAYTHKFVVERNSIAASCYARRGKMLKGREPVTFAEYVQCLLEDYKNNKLLDPHVAPLYLHCSFCAARYSYIATLETMADDFRYLSSYVFPQKTKRSYYDSVFYRRERRPSESRNRTITSYNDCYASLTPQALSSLTNMYRRDALLFGYPDAPL